MSKRIGDASRKRRFADAARQAYYAGFRCRRWARRFFGEPPPPAGENTPCQSPEKESNIMTKTRQPVVRQGVRPGLQLVMPVEGVDAGPPAVGNDNPLMAKACGEAVALSTARPPSGRAGGWGLPVAPAAPDGLLSVLPACVTALERVAKELRLTPEQEFGALDDFLKEVGREAPQIVVGLFVRSQLPNIRARAFRHFLRKRKMSHDDAEDLSQDVVVKVLKALTKPRLRGNFGALLASILHNVYRDHWRQGDRRASGMGRLEKAFNVLRTRRRSGARGW